MNPAKSVTTGAVLAFFKRLRDVAHRRLNRNPPHRRRMLREFRDTKGVEWLVWDVYPSAASGDQRISDPGAAFPHRELADGWLCFESGSEKRRVAPIPKGWEEFSAEQLEGLCRSAGYISRPGVRDTPSQRADGI
jgi:hypothetical protein